MLRRCHPLAGDDHQRSFSIEAYRSVRAETERRAAPLSAEDQAVQSMPDASPAKWHRAHTTWFFEQFLLVPHLPGYQVYDPQFAFSVQFLLRGGRPAACATAAEAMVTRPDVAHVGAYRGACRYGGRTAVGDRGRNESCRSAAHSRNWPAHEQQHQELLLTDILHVFAQKPHSRRLMTPNWQETNKSIRVQLKLRVGFVTLPAGLHSDRP